MFDFPHASITYPHHTTHSVVVAEAFDTPPSWIHPLLKASDLTALGLAESQVEELSRMEENWDGYGALPISRATKYNALSVLRGIVRHAPTPDITPNPNGTVSFEWESPRGKAHLEIGQTRLSFYITPVAGTPIFKDASASDILLNSISIGILVSSNLFPLQHGTTSITKIDLVADVSSAY
jgi:hypothetical protein